MKFSKIINESPTLKFAESANKMKQEGKSIISLGLGEPDFDTPEYITRATIDAMINGYTHYSSSQGLLELRKLISLDYCTRYNFAVNEKEITIVPGVKAGIYFSLASILEPNNEVIILSPYYVSYPSMIKLAEPSAKIIDIALRKDFTIPLDLIKKAVTKNTKCIILNFPNNPSGMIASEDEMQELINIVKESNMYLLSDEVYDKLVFDEGVKISFAQFECIKDKLIIVNGYSKSYAMTGWRIGYVIAPSSITEKIIKVNQNIMTNTTTFIQKGACSIYLNDEIHLSKYLLELKKRIDYFHDEITKMPYFEGIKPKGGFFYFVNISKTHMKSNEFCAFLIEKTGIATTPGLAFGKKWDNYVRFSLATKFSNIEEAIRLIKGMEFV